MVVWFWMSSYVIDENIDWPHLGHDLLYGSVDFGVVLNVDGVDAYLA